MANQEAASERPGRGLVAVGCNVKIMLGPDRLGPSLGQAEAKVGALTHASFLAFTSASFFDFASSAAS